MQFPKTHHLCAQVTLVFGVLNAACAQSDDGSPPLKNLAEVVTAYDSPERRVAVDLIATVNYWNRNHRLLFVQDEHTAVYVEYGEQEHQRLRELSEGTHVRVVGHVVTDEYILEADQITIVDDGPAVKPLDVDLSQTILGKHWSYRIRTTGTVQNSVSRPEGTWLSMRQGSTEYTVMLRQRTSPEYNDKLVGAEIAFEGTLSCETNAAGNPVRFLVYVMGVEKLSFTQPAPQKQRAQAISVGQLNADPGRFDGQLVKLSGQVGFVERNVAFVIEAPDGALRIAASETAQIAIGDTAELLVLFDDRRAVLRQFDYRHNLPVSVPELSAAVDLVARRKSPQRVQVRGQLIDVNSIAENRILTVDDDGITFQILVNADNEAFQQLNLDRAHIVSCAGLLSEQTTAGHNAEFSVQLASSADLVVERNRVYVDQTSAVWATAGLLTALLFGAGWLTVLRRQVGARTHDLSKVTAFLRSSFDAVHEGLIVTDTSSTVLLTNRRVAELFQTGIEQISQLDQLRTALADRLDDQDEFLSAWKSAYADPTCSKLFEAETRQPKALQLRVQTAPVCDEAGEPVARLWTIEDLTEQRRLEATLVQSQKMEAVGRLAGGVAHDFNNLLMGISGNLELVRNRPSATVAETSKLLDAAEDSADRAAQLVKHLLGFSRQTQLDLKPSNVNDAVERLIPLLARVFLSANLKVDRDPDVWTTEFDETHFQQVLLNICLNARDALDDEGKIRISTANVTTDDGDFVRVSVEDNGCGMSADIRSRIFEPFFTTKKSGEGTGLGLSMSYGIIEQHNGHIECSSTPDVGTRFNVYLPRKADQSLPEPVLLSMKSTELPTPGQTRSGLRILLADDEQMVRSVGSMMLDNAGHNVECAEDGGAVLRILQEDPDFDVLILDLAMPVLSGQEVYQHVSTHFPKLPVIVCSGYLTHLDDFAHKAGKAPINRLAKPFKSDELLATIDSVARAS